METMLKAFVIAVQLALVGFVLWGAWLCFSAWLLELRDASADRRARKAARAPVKPVMEAKPQVFERVASLVLLALLCTTISGLF